MGTLQKHPCEAIQMGTQNIYFGEEIQKLIPNYRQICLAVGSQVIQQITYSEVALKTKDELLLLNDHFKSSGANFSYYQ